MTSWEGRDRRRKRRVRLPGVIRVRPSDPGLHLGLHPGLQEFDEILSTLNVTREGVYFVSKNQNYRKGMRVFITYPYSDSRGSINRECLGEVMRVEELDHGQYGIAIKILMPVYLGGQETLR